MFLQRLALCLVAALALPLGLSAPATADFGIGFATAVTGSMAAIGGQARRGAEAAVADINAKGGVLGQKLRLDVEDDACEPRQAVSVANRFVASGVKIVLGHLCSGASIAGAGVYADQGLIMISASATAPDLTAKSEGSTIFRACGRDDQQGTAAGLLLADRFRDKRIALVHDKSAYGAGLVAQAAKAMREAGVRPSLEGAINAGERDFAALISRLKAEGIDIVYFGGYHTELGLIVRQAREAGFGGQFLGAEGIATNEFWAITGEAGAGTLFTYAPEVKTRPAAQEAIKVMRAKDPSIEPDNFSFYYFAAVQVIAQAIERAKSAEPDAIATALRDKPFMTVVGEMAFDDKGDLKAPEYVFYEWKDGRYAPAF